MVIHCFLDKLYMMRLDDISGRSIPMSVLPRQGFASMQCVMWPLTLEIDPVVH